MDEPGPDATTLGRSRRDIVIVDDRTGKEWSDDAVELMARLALKERIVRNATMAGK